MSSSLYWRIRTSDPDALAYYCNQCSSWYTQREVTLREKAGLPLCFYCNSCTEHIPQSGPVFAEDYVTVPFDPSKSAQQPPPRAEHPLR